MIQQAVGNATVDIRIANFTELELSWKNVLNFDLINVQQIADEIRKYADLPYIYILSNNQIEMIVELLTQLKSIRSTCYPYAIILVEDSDRSSSIELFTDKFDLDIILIDNTDTETINRKIRDYAASKFTFDKSKLMIENTSLIPNYVDVIVVGAGITGLYAANKSL